MSAIAQLGRLGAQTPAERICRDDRGPAGAYSAGG
jgi:hypothetical protein